MEALPAIIEQAGPIARFDYEEFFTELDNSPHTIAAYRLDPRRFLAHVHDSGLALPQVTLELVRAGIADEKNRPLFAANGTLKFGAINSGPSLLGLLTTDPTGWASISSAGLECTAERDVARRREAG